jgi:hypothetical protein
MSKLIWVNNNKLFKITKVIKLKYLCICSSEYKEELNLQIGDIIFLKDYIKIRSYKRLGKIISFDKKKVIIESIGDIVICSKKKMTKLHYKSTNLEEIK